MPNRDELIEANQTTKELSEAELDKVSAGMEVRIGQASSNIATADSGSVLSSGVLQGVVSSVVESLNNQAHRPR
jgi:hypothetical protein